MAVAIHTPLMTNECLAAWALVFAAFEPGFGRLFTV